MLAVPLALLAGTALASDFRVTDTPGFSGNVLVGAGYLEMKSNLIAGNKLIDVKNKTVSSVNASPKSESDVYPFFTGEVDYTFGDRWQAYFGSSIQDLVTLDMSQRLGIRKQWDGVGVMGAAFLLSGIPAEVWEDPYQAGTPRQDTNRDSTGIQFNWFQILESNFFLQLSARDIDIDTEESGTDPALGLTPGEIRSLRRDGTDTRATLGYRWKNGNSLWQPELTFGNNDRDGNAVSSDSVNAKLSYSYIGDKSFLVITGAYFSTEFDKANPVYNKRTDDDGYALSASYSHKLAMGDGNWSWFGMVNYVDSDSDVNFHDATAFGVNAGLAYSFGRNKK